MGQTAKNSCPKCAVKFRTGALPTELEQRRLRKLGIIDLGEPPENMECPACKIPLRVVAVSMGTFFTLG